MMHILLNVCLLIALLVPLPSHFYPVPSSNRVERKTVDSDKGHFSPGELDDQDLSSQHSEEGVESDQNVQAISPDAADTMHKINPLTIADQVSQMFHKNNQKIDFAKRSKTVVADPQRNMRGGSSQDDQGYALPNDQASEREDSLNPGYTRQDPPKIVNKPLSNDFGYSVIVLAGDAAHLPMKMTGKSSKETCKKMDDRNEYVNVLGQGVFKTGEAEEKITSEEKSNNGKKEVHVLKQFSKNPEFPVYDDDFFDPDPLHGLLDENYWDEPDKNDHLQKTALPLDDFRHEDTGYGPHKVHVRSDDEVDDGNDGEDASCGSSWGKNSTDSGSSAKSASDNCDKGCNSYKNTNLTNAALLKRSAKLHLSH